MAKSAAAPVLEIDPGSFQVIPLAKLVESPSNHRRKSWGDLDELAGSIKEKGVLVPICVRPSPSPLVPGTMEIIYGHRRFRAATIAGIPGIPARVVDLTDVEVIEWQLIENKDRVDTHPLEDAEGMEQLLKPRGPYTIEDIAAKLTKSKAYVYGRLKLLDLTPESREAYYQGTLSASTALYLARIPAQLQKAALAALMPRWRQEDDGPMSAREASRILQQNFMCVLKDAPFPVTDPDLVPAAGACSSCPKRTGAQPELFEDVQGADVCTDPDCYASKRDAEWTKRAAAAEAAGKKVLTAAETKATFSRHGGSYIDSGSAYVDLDGVNGQDPKGRTWRKLLGKRATDAIVLAKDPNGGIRELLPKAETRKLLKAAGHDFKAERSTPSSPGVSKEQAAKVKAEQELEDAVEKRRTEAVVEALKTKKEDATLWRIVAGAVAEYADDALDRRIGEIKGKGRMSETAYLDGLNEKDLRAFVLEASLQSVLGRHPYGDQVKLQKQLFAWAGIDEKAIRAEAKAVQKAIAPAPAKGEAKKGTCRKCGCKQNSPCPQGCAWTDKTKTLCTACASEGDLDAEKCLDCGIPAGKPSPGCEECDHGRTKKPAKKAARR